MDSTAEHRSTCVVVHGGAWAIPDNLKNESTEGVKRAATIGHRVLLKGGSALDAVEAAVRSLEDNPVFDAGHGSVLTEDLTVEVDAMIMDGDTMNTGAVAAVKGIANPVSLARHVLQDTPHCLLVSDGALKFARKINFPVLENPLELITEESRQQLKDMKTFDKTVLNCFNTSKAQTPGHDTVGAVAMDTCGRLASATSTGGISMKMTGRVGDSPLVGSGGYANKFGAVSTTGHGESIMKTVLAREVVYHIEQGSTSQQSCEAALRRMFEDVSGQGGVIALDVHGRVGRHFTTKRMPWASVKDSRLCYGIEPNEECFTGDIE